MSNILRIDSSIFGENGNSASLTAKLTAKLAAQLDEVEIVHRDFSKRPIPHYDAGTVQAIGEGRATLANTLITEIKNADIVVIGAPMYNFGIPSQLKSWLDHIARAQVTFKYGENGPEGLLTGKQVYVVTARGGQYKNTPTDTLVPYMKIMLGFLGLDEQLEFIYAEQLARSEFKDTAISAAESDINQLVAGGVA